jgi:hypothetical protein
MPTYRALSLDELKLFEKEFTEYLAINGIDAELWKKIKETDEEKVHKIIDTFSDVIYNSVLHKMEYIQYSTLHDIKYFFYGKEEAKLIGIQSEEMTFEDPQKVVEAVQERKVSIKTYKTSKKYSQKREVELFDMLKNGCQPCDGKMFKLLSSIV